MTANPAIDDLLERAVGAINNGDRATADALAGQVLGGRQRQPATPRNCSPRRSTAVRSVVSPCSSPTWSTRPHCRSASSPRSTALSSGGYRDDVRNIVTRYEGHIGSIKGDGLLAVFGHPKAHEDDAHRAVLAGLDIIREVAALSAKVRRPLQFRHRRPSRDPPRRGLPRHRPGRCLRPRRQSRGADLQPGPTGHVTVSMAIERVVRDNFDMDAACPPQRVKGLDEAIRPPPGRRRAGHRTARSVRPLCRAGTGTRRIWKAVGPGQRRDVDHPRRDPARRGRNRQEPIGQCRTGHGPTNSGAAVLELFGSPFHTDIGLRPVRRLIERRCGFGATRIPQTACSCSKWKSRAARWTPRQSRRCWPPFSASTPDAGTRPATATPAHASTRSPPRSRNTCWHVSAPAQPLFLAEDIHWYDEDTIELVNSLLRVTTTGCWWSSPDEAFPR